MSLSLCTDELLLELLPPERIASLTYYSREPGNLRIWPQAARVPVNWGGAEEILAAKPDLVLAGTYTTPGARALLERLNFPLLEIPPANDFEQIRQTTRWVARALAREAEGEALITRMDATLHQLRDSAPTVVIRVVAWGEGGSVPGRGTLFDAILRAAGGVNIAANSEAAYTSFDLEQLILARPDVIAYSSQTLETPGIGTDQAQHPLLQALFRGRRITYPGALYSCGVVESADAAVALRAGLLKAMSRAP